MPQPPGDTTGPGTDMAATLLTNAVVALADETAGVPGTHAVIGGTTYTGAESKRCNKAHKSATNSGRPTTAPDPADPESATCGAEAACDSTGDLPHTSWMALAQSHKTEIKAFLEIVKELPGSTGRDPAAADSESTAGRGPRTPPSSKLDSSLSELSVTTIRLSWRVLGGTKGPGC